MRFLSPHNWHSDCRGITAFAVDADRNASSEDGQPISTEAVADLALREGGLCHATARVTAAVMVQQRRSYRRPTWPW
jgi:hypothetical protein